MRQLFFFSCLFCCLSIKSYSQQHSPNIFHLTISDHGLAKASASSFVEYQLEDFKLNYNYNYTGSLGMGDLDEHAKKKFGHREQRGLYHFLEEAQEFFKEDLEFNGDDSEHVVEVRLDYTLHGEKKHWTAIAGREQLEVHESYKKILELEGLVREMARLKPR